RVAPIAEGQHRLRPVPRRGSAARSLLPSVTLGADGGRPASRREPDPEAPPALDLRRQVAPDPDRTPPAGGGGGHRPRLHQREQHSPSADAGDRRYRTAV